MIRFIDLRGQILDEENDTTFAFFNTVNDQFITFYGYSTWTNKKEFIEDFISDCILGEANMDQKERYIGLMPDWVPEGDDEPQTLGDA